MSYEPVSSRTPLPEEEKRVLRFWKENRIFEKSLENRRGAREFVFYDGPPFATGLPHYGHLLAGTIKDIVPRYQTMRGFRVERRFGWDCHGLPVEYEVEQDLSISGKRDIEKMGVAVFNERCRSIVLRYTSEWRDIVTRMGRWVDFDNDYKTMDPSYMESIWWVFKALWDRNLIYEGYRVVWYCPRCATPLSNFETNQGYQDVDDPAITVRFRSADEPNTWYLAWTTTPWTLPSNTALAVGENIPYVKIRDGGACYWLARDRLPVFYPGIDPTNILETAPGSSLQGRKYLPLFPYFANAAGGFRIVAAAFVSTDEGTGIVHMAPGFGEDDYRVGQALGLPTPCPIDAECRFTDEVPDYAGRYVKDVDSDIIRRLKSEGAIVRHETLHHSYPHCWRCDSPLISRAISAWYVRVETLRDRIIAANAQTKWMPAHLRDGRFGKWLENARDWNISRDRYWGTPLPVWKSADGKEVVCVGSVAELEALSGRHVADLHKHVVDMIVIPSRRGGEPLRRVPQVLDCWFESGAMPYAQAHYPFENRDRFEKNFPADFIAEGLDQTRGWFYTLMVLSTALFDKPAFKNVVVNGLVLAEDGRKMSKRLKNYPDPAYIIESYGADALRLYLISSPVVRAEDLRFSENGVRHTMRSLLIPLWNAYSFFVTYARLDGWTTDKMAATPPSSNMLDRWILSSLAGVIADVTDAMDSYDLQRSVRPFLRFMDDLTNWYIRRSRRRFWKSQDDEDKIQAYRTLNMVLLEFSRLAAPFIPFLSESMYRNLRTDSMPESVHLADFPDARSFERDRNLEDLMDTVLTAVRLGRQLRAEHNLKVRQPLNAIHVVSRSESVRARVQALQDLILDELNVKSLKIGSDERNLADLSAKPNYRRLGPRLGPRMKSAAAAISAMTADDICRMQEEGRHSIRLDGEEIVLAPEDIVVERARRSDVVVAAEGEILVALETNLTEDLILEGLAREIVSRLQNQRKNMGLDVAQRISRLYWTSDEAVARASSLHAQYINSETLCIESALHSSDPSGEPGWEQLDINGKVLWSKIMPR